MAEEINTNFEEVIGQALDEDDRAALKYLMDYLQPLSLRAAEETAAMGRWLLASLLATNGGAIITLVNSEEINGPFEILAIMLWFLGILLALGSGLLSLRAGQRGGDMLAKMISTLLGGLHSGKLPDLRFEGEMAEVKRRGEIIIRVGLLSLAAFVSGSFVVASALIIPAPPPL